MPLLAALLVLLSLFRPAHAVDGHGTAVLPCSPELLAPMVTWAPGSARAQVWSACVGAELVEKPVVATVTDGQVLRNFVALDDVVGLRLGGTVGFGRIGLGMELPLWVTSTNDSAVNDASLGDIRLYVPLGILQAQTVGALGLDAVVELLGPTGNTSNLLGADGLGVGAHFVLGARGEHFGGSADLGIGYTAADSLPGMDTRLWTRLAVAGDWRPIDQVGFGLEAWFSAAPLSAENFAFASPGEILLRVGAQPVKNFTVSLAGGTAITPGVGASEYRALLRLGYGAPQRFDAASTATTDTPTAQPALPPPGPFDVLVSVRSGDGKPVDAALTWEGTGVPEAGTTGADGEARATLSPGDFSVTVSAQGYISQRRTLTLAADRFRPERVDVVLQPSSGDGTLRLGVVDSEGRAVAGALVDVDGKPQGTTASGGTLDLIGISEGEHEVAVAKGEFRARSVQAVVVPQAEAAVLVMERPPGSVRVITRGPSGPVADARVRFSGPEERGPDDVGAEGERVFTLLPGSWTMVASAQAFGTQEREFTVEPGRTALVIIDVKLNEAEAGESRLVVRVVDPAGNPVEGAEVLIDGASVGRTANGGALTLDGLKGGDRVLSARGERFRDAAERTVSLTRGTREVTLPLSWRPGQLHLVARGVEGVVLDARVRFDGPEEVPASTLGPDGEAWYELAPGNWTLAISSTAYGLQEREIRIEPDDVTLVDLSAGLLSAAGEGSLAVTVLDSAGVPLEGARLSFDGRDIGTTANSGAIDLGSLAAGKHELIASLEGYKPRSKTITLAKGKLAVELRLDADARAVNVVARGPAAPAADALLRAYGADIQPPVPVDAEGRRSLALAPGAWSVVAVSEQYGIAERDVDVAAGSQPMAVELKLEPPKADTGTLLVELVDPAGAAVQGATLTVDGNPIALGTESATLLRDRKPGVVKIGVSAPGYAARLPELADVGPGVQTLRIKLAWVPRPVEVTVRAADGKAVDAELRAFGPGRVEPVRTGADGVGTFSLRPGAWQIVASAKGYGPFRQDLELTPGTSAVPVLATLASEQVQVTATSVVILQKVNFAFDQADIDPGSYPVLDQVASILLLNPHILQVEVQGHTDNRGADIYNLDLSQRRSEAVRAYLVRSGVDPGRIVAKGYGNTVPIADNATEAGRAKNRRVQFEIVPTAPGP